MESTSRAENREQRLTCHVCRKADNHRRFIVKEMMFGLREPFEYFECSACGCIQIKVIPPDLSVYYRNYYSHEKLSRLRILIKGQWLTQPLRGANILRRLMCVFPGYNPKPEWLARHPVPKSSAVLDVGCGVGQHLLEMRCVGYKNLLGVDLFVPGDIRYSNGVRILKRDPLEMTGRFDLITLHHSLEHMTDQHRVLSQMRNLLADDGVLVIRVPVAASYACRRYGPNWVGLDAPRHLYLHTPVSLSMVAAESGLEVFDSYCDVNELPLLWSEQYVRDIPLFDAKSIAVTKGHGIFTKEEIRDFRKMAKTLNEKGEGDQMAFYLRKRTT